MKANPSLSSYDNPTEAITERWNDRRDLTGPQKAWLRRRGVSETPWRGDPYDQIKRLKYAGFSATEVMSLIDLEPLEVLDRWRAADPSLQLIVGLHALGLTPKEISEETSMKRQNVYYHLQQLGLKPNTASPELTAEEKSEIADRCRHGQSIQGISDDMKLPYHKVRYFVRKLHDLDPAIFTLQEVAS